MNLFVDNSNTILIEAYQTARGNSRIVDSNLTVTLADQAVTGVITNASNASPIVITSAAHGLSNGDQVAVVQVEGNLAANGSFTVANVTTNSFELSGSTGSGAWSASAKAKWYKAIPGAVSLSFTYYSADHLYEAVLSDEIPLIDGGRYIAIIQSANYEDHWEVPMTATVRKG